MNESILILKPFFLNSLKNELIRIAKMWFLKLLQSKNGTYICRVKIDSRIDYLI